MDDLAKLIAARLRAELERARFHGPEVRENQGLVDLDDYSAGDDIYPHLSIDDVARIASETARSWF